MSSGRRRGETIGTWEECIAQSKMEKEGCEVEEKE